MPRTIGPPAHARILAGSCRRIGRTSAWMPRKDSKILTKKIIHGIIRKNDDSSTPFDEYHASSVFAQLKPSL
jgi:hypothetical protein